MTNPNTGSWIMKEGWINIIHKYSIGMIYFLLKGRETANMNHSVSLMKKSGEGGEDMCLCWCRSRSLEHLKACRDVCASVVGGQISGGGGGSGRRDGNSCGARGGGGHLRNHHSLRSLCGLRSLRSLHIAAC